MKPTKVDGTIRGPGLVLAISRSTQCKLAQTSACYHHPFHRAAWTMRDVWIKCFCILPIPRGDENEIMYPCTAKMRDVLDCTMYIPNYQEISRGPKDFTRDEFPATSLVTDLWWEDNTALRQNVLNRYIAERRDVHCSTQYKLTQSSIRPFFHQSIPGKLWEGILFFILYVYHCFAGMLSIHSDKLFCDFSWNAFSGPRGQNMFFAYNVDIVLYIVWNCVGVLWWQQEGLYW